MGEMNGAVLCVALFCMAMSIILICTGAGLITETPGHYQDSCEVMSIYEHSATVYGGCTINEYSSNTGSNLCILFGLIMFCVAMFALFVGTGVIEL